MATDSIKCWELFQCTEFECPVYKRHELHCWLYPGTRCTGEYQGAAEMKILECLNCPPFQENIDPETLPETLDLIRKRFAQFDKKVQELETVNQSYRRAMAQGLSEVLQALARIAAGDPSVRLEEQSEQPLMVELKRMINLTAENLGEIVDLSHEFAIGLAEHFDVLHRVVKGDLSARIQGASSVELLEALKKLTNRMIQSVAQEISDRKNAETALKESEERYKKLYDASKKGEAVYRSLIHSSPDPIVLYDLDGRTRYVSPAFTDLFGWTLEEVQGKRIDFVPAEEKERSLAIIKQVVEQGIPCRGFETRRLTKTGQILDLSLSSSRFDDHEGRPAGLLVLLRDITMTRRLENQLQQSQKMEAIGTLASGIAHDFNNILQSISGCVQVVMTKTPASDGTGKFLTEIDQAVTRASGLIRQLLTFGRRMEPTMTLVNLNERVEHTVKLLERTLPKMIRIEMTLAQDLSRTQGDPNQIEQVIMNLATNARDSMPTGGGLILETENIYLDGNYCCLFPEITPGLYVRLRVSDTGSGIDRETLKHIYEPFFTTKEVGKGSGLGLSMVYGIVKAHRGHLTCYSEQDRGTTFNIYLPAKEAEGGETVRPQVPDLEKTGGNETILIVDDEPAILEATRDIFLAQGYRVVTAGSGEESLALFREESEPIDLVLMDLGMPGMGGQACLKEIKALDPDIPVIITSGYSVSAQTFSTLLAGASCFIGKPYRFNELLASVRRILDTPTKTSSQFMPFAG